MTTRILPIGDYPRLVGTELETVWPVLPETARVLVVEDEGMVIGCWALMPVFHLEGLWIHPDRRKGGSVARRLWSSMQTLARSVGARAVGTSACSDEVRALLAHVGAIKVPGDHFVMKVS